MYAHEVFEFIARNVWRVIEHAHRNGIIFGEDAITSINLNAIASASPHNVVFEDTRVDEARRGCDFELWIGNDSNGWFRYALQAKKISMASGRYEKLNHEVSGRRQVDILEDYSRANKAAALYCFYNNSSKISNWNCNLPPDFGQLGCSVTPSAVVQTALASRGCRTFDWFHNRRETLPWSCLVRCPLLIGHGGSSGPPGWPARKEHFHKQLPSVLTRLREERTLDVLTDTTELFNSNIELRPTWLGIIDVSDIRG